MPTTSADFNKKYGRTSLRFNDGYLKPNHIQYLNEEEGYSTIGNVCQKKQEIYFAGPCCACLIDSSYSCTIIKTQTEFTKTIMTHMTVVSL